MENRYSGILPGEGYIGICALADFFCLRLKYPTLIDDNKEEGSRGIGVGVKTNIDNSKKKDVGKSGNDIKIIGTARFSSIAGKKVLNCRLLRIALSAMVTIEHIDQKGGLSGVYVSMSRSEAGHRCMIGWVANSVYMKGWVSA